MSVNTLCFSRLYLDWVFWLQFSGVSELAVFDPVSKTATKNFSRARLELLLAAASSVKNW